MKILVLDTETTGVDPVISEICEIGMALYEYDVNSNEAELLEEYETLIKPEEPIPPEASAVNHITNEMVKDAPSIDDQDVVHRVSCMVSRADYFVAHNLPFDWTLLVKQMPDIFGGIKQDRLIDTCRFAKKVLDEDPSHKLMVMRYRYDLPVSSCGDSHRALFDVKLCLEAFRLVQSREKHELEDLAEFISKPYLITVFPMGKHRGSDIAETIGSNPDYIRWMLRQPWLPQEWPDLHYTIIVLMRQRGMIKDREKEQEKRDFFK